MDADALALFRELADRSRDERDEFYARHGIPAAVCAEVESLLRFDRKTDNTFRACVADAANEALYGTPGAGAAAQPPGSLAGQVLGSYTLTSPLGQGGMGSVWLARRSDGRFEGVAAVKLLKAALVGHTIEERFRREGNVLARFRHPHIAQLIDAGVAASGQPYLLLEYVDGDHIDRWCDGHKLGIEDRIKVFLDVLTAVAHAHGHLIVHRDLKPSNILVSHDGRVKLLDFGVAKLLEDEQGGSSTLLTHDGSWPLTPAYASPEQLTGGAVTIATDIYSLGVVLYLLLCGRHPYVSPAQSPADLITAIVHTDPPRVSDAAYGHEETAAEGDSRAASRATTADRLRRTLRGELDTIIAKTLKKNPQERYSSVTAFADDLRRYLAHQPISAMPDTVTYRSVKFVRRHRSAVAAAVAVVVTLAAATALTTREMLEARRQRDQAEFQRRRAQASSEFMRYLVTQIGSEPMTMREVLDRGRMALEQQWGGDPAFVARMLIQLSGPYLDIDDRKTSAAMMARALEIAETIGDPDLLATTHCGTGHDLADAGDFEGARRHLAVGEEYARRVEPAKTNSECAIGSTRLALAERRYDEAIAHASRRVAALELEEDTATTNYTSALNNLANAYNGAGRLLDVLAVERRMTEISRRIGRGETIGVVVSLNNQGSTLRRLGRWLEADLRFTEAVVLAARAEREGRIPAYLLVNHARLLVSLHRADEALALLERARSHGEVPSPFAEVARLTGALAQLQRSELDGARAAYRELNEEASRASGRGPSIPVLLLGAEIALADDKPAEAHPIVQRALEQLRSGTPSPWQPEVLEIAARTALDLGEHETALRQAHEAIRASGLQLGGDVPNAYAGRARLALGTALAGAGRPSEATLELMRAVTILEQSAGASHPWTVEARTRMADLNR